MVLEEASNPQEPASYSETLPSSDIDPYSSSATEVLSTRPSTYLRLDQSGDAVYINLQNLPQPFTFSSIFFAQQQSAAISRSISGTCRYASNILQRPLRQEEADAFAFHLSKSVRTASFGGPVGVVTAMAFATTGGRMEAFRFPGGWSPAKEGSRFSVDKFLTLRGSLARMSWQWMRLGSYGFLGSILGNLFFASYALTLHATGRATDPRLEDWNEAIKNVDRNRARMAMKQGEQQGEAAGKGSGETFEMAKQRRNVRETQRRDQLQEQVWGGKKQMERKRVDDDMSPTSGAFEEEFMGLDNAGESELMSDGRARRQQNTPPSTLDTSSSSSGYQQSPSPTPSNTQQNTPQPQEQPTSSWDRLRQSAMSGTGSPQQSSSPRSQPSSRNSGSDSFSFSQNDEDKQLAQSEAQREFDARVEREREGRNFDEKGGGRGGRW